ncbi:MAG: hypothetical protein M5U29_02600 [Anaerolineae bacterium]|nr:hypothetical protein [Anaerolineae bacterium]
MARSFGELVKALQRSHTYFDEESGADKPWNQAILAKHTDGSSYPLSEHQVGDIEQDTVVDICPYLEPLAFAFELKEYERREFYAAARCVNQDRKSYMADTLLRRTLHDIPYPAFAVTPLWDCIAENRYAQVAHNMTDKRIEEFSSGALGPNRLRMLFDPSFGMEELLKGEHMWQWTAKKLLWLFRNTSFRYMATNRYGKIIKEMRKFRRFRRIFEEVLTGTTEMRHPSIFSPSYIEPEIQIHHPEFNLLIFLLLEYPIEYTGSELRLFVYAPKHHYSRFFESVTHNDVTFYERYPFD